MFTPHATANSLQIRARARPEAITRHTGRTLGSVRRLKGDLMEQITCTFTVLYHIYLQHFIERSEIFLDIRFHCA
jgi:hypothetical protein